MMSGAPRTKTRGSRKRTADAQPELTADPDFARVLAAFAKDPKLTYGGQGFGSSALKVGGSIFAMLASRGRFVVKLPRECVDELVRLGAGERFDPGHGRPTREWVVIVGTEHWVKAKHVASSVATRADDVRSPDAGRASDAAAAAATGPGATRA